MRALLLLAAAVVALGGCATRAERQAAQIDRAKWACADMGFQPETPAHAQCTQQLYMQSAGADQARRDAALMQGYQILATPPARPAPPPAAVTCRQIAGGMVCQ